MRFLVVLVNWIKETQYLYLSESSDIFSSNAIAGYLKIYIFSYLSTLVCLACRRDPAKYALLECDIRSSKSGMFNHAFGSWVSAACAACITILRIIREVKQQLV